MKISLKNEQEIEDGTEYITKLIQDYAWAITPEPNDKHIVNVLNVYPIDTTATVIDAIMVVIVKSGSSHIFLTARIPYVLKPLHVCFPQSTSSLRQTVMIFK